MCRRPTYMEIVDSRICGVGTMVVVFKYAFGLKRWSRIICITIVGTDIHLIPDLSIDCEIASYLNKNFISENKSHQLYLQT